MPKKRNLLRLHWLFGVAWMLVLAWMCLLSAVATGGQPSTSLSTFNLMATLNLVALSLGVVIVLFALAYGLGSPWGFGVHHNRWIIAQWVLVLGTILTGATMIRSWIGAGIVAASHGTRVATGSLTLTLMVQILVLMAVIVIAVRKPGSRRAGPTAPAAG